ncbi:MAG TPA: DUF5677 domain-containing protein [Parafilimonas sp.]|nr:DUF5677 domain-containing protein [Parafilimonas sp.]
MNIQEDRAKIAAAYFEAINLSNLELYRCIKNKLEDVRPVYPLVEFIIERLTVVTQLTFENSLWDAEIIFRSALETYIKLIFILSADDEERKIRLKEYWEDLEEINRLKQSEQAKKNLAITGDTKLYKLAFSPLMLTEEKEAELREKWNKTRRKEVERKWSFSEIIFSLTKNYKGVALEAFILLTHSYRMASHVTHGDETGILIIAERNQRSESDKIIADFAHFIRLMSDSFGFCVYMGMEVCSFIKEDTKVFTDLIMSLKEIQELCEAYQLKLYDDPCYDNYRN